MVCDAIKNARPSKLYLIADGPSSDDEIAQCQDTRKAVEKRIDWNCEIEKIYSDTNLGCAQRIKSGLDLIFEREEKAIILEDDTLPNASFLSSVIFALENMKAINLYFIYRAAIFSLTKKMTLRLTP